MGTYPNPGFDLSSVTQNNRNGIQIPPKINLKAPDWVQTVRGASFFTKGPKLFNILPQELRTQQYLIDPTQEDIKKFKEGVDKYLARVPDQPKTEGLQRVALTNSILFQDQYKTNE